MLLVALKGAPLPGKRVLLTKTFLVMRLTTILILATCLHLSAKTLAQPISLSEQHVSLDKIFKKITERAAAALAVLEDKRLAVVLEDRRLVAVLAEDLSLAAGRGRKWSLLTVARYDRLLRGRLREGLEIVRAVLSELDVYISVGNLAQANGWNYAVAMPPEENVIMATGLRHPGVPHAVGNWIGLHRNGNMLFLTGANMAGKSTYMKAVGIAVYLAHMGFPVAAEKMAFSVRDGLFSST